MPVRRRIHPTRAEALVEHARAAVVAARERLEGLVAAITDGLPDPRRAREVGRLLDEIARSKLYRVAGHASLDEFLRDALGISRTTAYRLRRIARAPSVVSPALRGRTHAYELARAADARARARRER